MKYLINISLSVFAMILTNSFTKTFDFRGVKSMTKESTDAKEGTATCIGK
jgi:hypothetical protein